MQLRAILFAKYLKHAHHSVRNVSRSDEDSHRCGRECGRTVRQFPHSEAGNFKLRHLREVNNAATRRMGRHISSRCCVATQQNRVCQSPLESHPQYFVPSVEIQNKSHRKPPAEHTFTVRVGHKKASEMTGEECQWNYRICRGCY